MVCSVNRYVTVYFEIWSWLVIYSSIMPNTVLVMLAMTQCYVRVLSLVKIQWWVNISTFKGSEWRAEASAIGWELEILFSTIRFLDLMLVGGKYSGVSTIFVLIMVLSIISVSILLFWDGWLCNFTWCVVKIWGLRNILGCAKSSSGSMF